MKKFSASLVLALGLLFTGTISAHAQAIGQACPDFTCDGDAVCRGNPPTCQANNATCNPGCSGSTPICDTSSGVPQCISEQQYGNQSVPGIPTGSLGNTYTNTSGSSGGGINTTQLSGYSNSIIGIINNILVPLLIAVAFIVFLWGVFKYFILGAAEPEARKEGAQFVLWGVIGFVIIFALWGLVNLLLGTLSLSAGGTHQAYPTL